VDICPAGDDSLDDDLDGVPDACDLCAGEDDQIDIDTNLVADCSENLLPNRTFDENVDDWTPNDTALTWVTDDAKGSATSGSAQVVNASAASFVRGIYATVNNLPAVGGTQLVTYGAQYNVPSGQEDGVVTARIDYYATNCSGASFESVDATASIDAWGTVVGQTLVPQTATCMTIRLRVTRASVTVGDDFRALFDNALLSRCDDFDENEVCD
jgi:hypothetical protein